ncbi:TPA: hypothetical protein ACVO1K_004451 [Vibrio diabolicus]
MLDIVSSKTAMAVGSTVFNTLKDAYQFRQKQRVDSFFKCVELRYEHMTVEQQVELNKNINSEDGRNILAGYVDAITQTSCERVRMAVALLYCQDSDFAFTVAEQRAFISGVGGITDHLVDFLLCAVRHEVSPGHYPYNRHIIRQAQVDGLGLDDLDGETIYAYVNDLVRRGLLLPEPAVGVLASKDSWFIGYGTSEKIQKFAQLLEKSGELLRS